MRTPLILPSYSSCTPPVLPVLPVLLVLLVPPVLLLYSSYTPFTPPALLLYSLYSSGTPPVLLPYPFCTPLVLHFILWSTGVALFPPWAVHTVILKETINFLFDSVYLTYLISFSNNYKGYINAQHESKAFVKCVVLQSICTFDIVQWLWFLCLFNCQIFMI